MAEGPALPVGHTSRVEEAAGLSNGVRLAVVEDVPELASILARAFADDPYFAYLAPSGRHRAQRMRAGWTAILRFASARLAATYTTNDRAGVAIWLPPSFSALSRIESLRLILAMSRMRGWRRSRAISDAVREINSRRRYHVPGPHYYLDAIGVEVGRQGRGLGRALMQPILERCDATGLPASLETANSLNLPLYERLGFRIVEELTLRDAGIECWLMVRMPPAHA